MSGHKRKKILIDPKVQFTLARGLALNWLYFFAIVVAIAAGVELVVQYPAQSFRTVVAGVWARHAQTLILLAVVVPLFTYRTIKLSHRFAGPIWRLRQEMQRVGRGAHVRPLMFRKDDFWRELAEDFNSVLRRLEAAERIFDDDPPVSAEANSSDKQPSLA